MFLDNLYFLHWDLNHAPLIDYGSLKLAIMLMNFCDDLASEQGLLGFVAYFDERPHVFKVVRIANLYCHSLLSWLSFIKFTFPAYCLIFGTPTCLIAEISPLIYALLALHKIIVKWGADLSKTRDFLDESVLLSNINILGLAALMGSWSTNQYQLISPAKLVRVLV